MATNQELAVVLRLVADQFNTELKKSQGALGRLSSFVSSMRVQLVAAGVALFAIAKTTANYGDELAKTSQQVGVSVEALAGLQHAAQLAGLTNEQLTTGLGQLAKNMFDMSLGTGEAIRAFDQLKLKATDANGKLLPVEELLFRLADKFQGMADSGLKTALAMQVFGKAGRDLIPMLNQGRQGIQDMMREAEALGLVMSEQDARAAEEFNDALTNLGGALRGIRNDLGTFLLEPLTKVIEMFTDATIKIRSLGTALSELRERLATQPIEGAVGPFGGLFALGEQLAAGAEEAEGKIRARAKTVPPSGVPAPTGTREDQTKILTAEKKLAEALIEERRKLAQADLDIEREHLDSKRLLREESTGILRDLELGLAQQRTVVELKALEARFALEVDSFSKRVALGFKTVQQEEATELAHETKLRAITNRIVLTKKKADQDIVKHRAEFGLAIQTLQEELGQAIVDMTSSEIAIHKRANDQILQDRVTMARALLEADELNLEGLKQLAVRRRQVLEAEQALELSNQDLTESGRLAIITRSTAAIDRERRIEVGGFVEGFREGLVKYSTDLEGSFGLARDMARETARAMQQAFQTFFFDLFEGKIRSMKDVLVGFLNFVKQIISSVLANLAATRLAGFISTFVLAATPTPSGATGVQQIPGGGFVNVPGFAGGRVVQRFALGGPVFANADRIPALLQQGEFVLSRKGVDTLNKLNQGQAPFGGGPGKVTVNIVNSGRTDQPKVNWQRQGEEFVMNVIFKNVAANGPLRPLLGGGGA